MSSLPVARFERASWASVLCLVFTGLTACGGGGNGWTMGVYQPSAQYAAQCQVPRTGSDPSTGKPYPDMQGTTLAENYWLRSWTNELYLWYREVPDQDPGLFSSTADYFKVLKTPATTSTNSPKDRFHFTFPTLQWEQMSQSGVDIGYGLTWVVVAGTPPRQVFAAYVWTGAAAGDAAAHGVVRGDEILSIDGVDINATDSAGINTIDAGLSPSAKGERHTFIFQNVVTSARSTVKLTAQAVTETPVPIATPLSTATGPVGYILFNDHIATAEQELITGIQTLKNANVKDLVLDLRYNGGGYLDIASELAYMIAGPGPTAGMGFDQQTWNDKHPSTNPVTGAPLTPTPFHTTSQGFSGPSGTALPFLGLNGLNRVFVLSSSRTCSASEAVINGLKGVNVQVIQIGQTTCGKPYGFYPQDNCGTTYFSIEFQGDNAQGFGAYTDGFSPQNSVTPTSAVLPGCSVADDVTHQLGDPAEGRLSAALNYRANGQSSCPTPPLVSAAPQLTAVSVRERQAPWRENRIMRR